ncbi:MAG: biopolymer transporter ExbB [Alphaproteobacteria bacterium CG_4_9_14_3_um_filter_47_13]|nr:MAG: biopolymer transporter ExbB [Alphaproteobacteria bacterium CG_4_9_14_3_um_filter_47_13]
MTSDAAQTQIFGKGDPDIKIQPPVVKPDLATILGLLFAMGLIIVAIVMGSSNANFLNGPSFLIVILGTMAATSVSYTGNELKHVPGIIGNTLIRRYRKPSVMAHQLMDIAFLARKKGLLILTGFDSELRKDPFLFRATQLVTDGYTGEDIDRVLGQEVDAVSERHRRAASVLRRASEIAPAMGLIGTLVGLVQMLAQLDDPASIGPAMALALLTTFYGAIMGTVILGPMAAKLERNSGDEAMIKNMILMTMGSIARQENPRRLEMMLNSELPPEEKITYFD